MNYYYIDYMIRQRQLAEIEECERRRLLFAAGDGEPGLMSTIKKRVVGLVRDVKGRIRGREKCLPIPSAFINPAAGTQGKGVEL